MQRKEPTEIFLKDYKPSEFLIDKVDLTFELDEKKLK